MAPWPLPILPLAADSPGPKDSFSKVRLWETISRKPASIASRFPLLMLAYATDMRNAANAACRCAAA